MMGRWNLCDVRLHSLDSGHISLRNEHVSTLLLFVFFARKQRVDRQLISTLFPCFGLGLVTAGRMVVTLGHGSTVHLLALRLWSTK